MFVLLCLNLNNHVVPNKAKTNRNLGIIQYFLSKSSSVHSLNEVWALEMLHSTVKSPPGLRMGLELKLQTLWLIYSPSPQPSKQKLHVDMSSDMIMAWNEKHISREKLFPGTVERLLCVTFDVTTYRRCERPKRRQKERCFVHIPEQSVNGNRKKIMI